VGGFGIYKSALIELNIVVKQPKGHERNVMTSWVFSERKNLGKFCKDFLFNCCCL